MWYSFRYMWTKYAYGISHWARAKLLLFDQGHCGNHLQCSVKSQNSGILRKSIFCVFRTFLALETQLLGSHNCKNFWSKLQFWRYRFQNSYFLGELTLDISKAMAWIKLFAISKVFYSFDRHTCSSHMFVIDVRHRCSSQMFVTDVHCKSRKNKNCSKVVMNRNWCIGHLVNWATDDVRVC